MEDNPKVDYKKMNRFFELCLDEFDILIVLKDHIFLHRNPNPFKNVMPNSELSSEDKEWIEAMEIFIELFNTSSQENYRLVNQNYPVNVGEQDKLDVVLHAIDDFLKLYTSLIKSSDVEDEFIKRIDSQEPVLQIIYDLEDVLHFEVESFLTIVEGEYANNNAIDARYVIPTHSNLGEHGIFEGEYANIHPVYVFPRNSNVQTYGNLQTVSNIPRHANSQTYSNVQTVSNIPRHGNSVRHANPLKNSDLPVAHHVVSPGYSLKRYIPREKTNNIKRIEKIYKSIIVQDGLRRKILKNQVTNLGLETRPKNKNAKKRQYTKKKVYGTSLNSRRHYDVKSISNASNEVTRKHGIRKDGYYKKLIKIKPGLNKTKSRHLNYRGPVEEI